MKINKIIDNLSFEKYLLLHMKSKVKETSYEEERKVFQEIMRNKKIINEIKKNIHVEGNILGDLEKINTLPKDSNEYLKLKDKIINVDEFKNNN